MKRLLFLLALLFSSPAFAEPRTGEYSEKLPIEEAIGGSRAQEFADAFSKKAKMEFQVYVPSTYDPENPPGILVYVSPSPSGAIPGSWKRMMDEQNLIWVSVRNSGNHRAVKRRIAETLAGTIYVARRYRTDAQRIYLTGFSGGGRVASIMAYYYPDVYDGVIYICGVNTFPDDDPALMAQMRQNRFVFLTGTKDFNRADTESAYHAYQDAGIAGIHLQTVRGLAHELPAWHDMSDALDWLNGDETGPSD